MINLIVTVFISILLLEVLWLVLNDCLIPLTTLSHVVSGILIGYIVWEVITYLKKKRNDGS